MAELHTIYRCVCCNKMGDEVESLVMLRNDGVYLCGSCVAVCASVILDNRPRFPHSCDKIKHAVGGRV